MGLLADFIVATEEEASAYDGDASFPDTHRLECKGLTELEVGTLYQIVQGQEVGGEDDEIPYEGRVIRVVDGGERLTVEVTPGLIRHLASASDADLDAWSHAWGRTAEIQCSGDEMLPILRELRRLSMLAVSESKSVYLWNCV